LKLKNLFVANIRVKARTALRLRIRLYQNYAVSCFSHSAFLELIFINFGQGQPINTVITIYSAAYTGNDTSSNKKSVYMLLVTALFLKLRKRFCHAAAVNVFEVSAVLSITWTILMPDQYKRFA
jgi:hypothetical protein